MSEKFFLYFPEEKCTVGPFLSSHKDEVFQLVRRGAKTLMICKTSSRATLELGAVAYNYEGESTDYATLEEYCSKIEDNKRNMFFITDLTR